MSWIDPTGLGFELAAWQADVFRKMWAPLQKYLNGMFSYHSCGYATARTTAPATLAATTVDIQQLQPQLQQSLPIRLKDTKFDAKTSLTWNAYELTNLGTNLQSSQYYPHDHM